MRADRLLSLMMLLQARSPITASDLAAELEVSERTIYRDIDALSVAGVPIYTQPGTHGGVFLDENYRLTLTGLSQHEIRALFVSGAFSPLHDLGYARAVEDTMLKLFAALPSMHRPEVERMRQRIHIDHSRWFQVPEAREALPVLQQAVWEDREVQMVYENNAGHVSRRVLKAYALVLKSNSWYLLAEKDNGEMRVYRVSRIQEATLTGQHFVRRADFDLATAWADYIRAYEEAQRADYVVTLRVCREAMPFFLGMMPYRYEQLAPPDAAGWLLVQAVFYSIYEARTAILGLGTRVRILDPPELRQAVLEAAREIVAFLEEEGV